MSVPELEQLPASGDTTSPHTATQDSPTTPASQEVTPQSSPASTVLHDLLASARERLIGLDGRTALLNYKLPRSRGVSIEGESPEALYRILVDQAKHMYFKGAGEPRELAKAEGALEQPALTEAELNDNIINTPHPDSELQTRLVKTANQARIDKDDRGVHTLYLALGFMSLSISGEKQVYAPLLLVPVHLEREGSRGRFRVVASEDDPVPNYALDVYLRTKLGINLPKPSTQSGDSTEFSLSSYFDAVTTAVNGASEIRIDREKSALSLFSFEGVSLYNDLDPAQWPEGRSPTDSPTLLRLVDSKPVRSHVVSNDPVTNISDHALVVPVDPSQLRCVEAAANGQDLVIYGPPGTGKSHTITAMIADLVAQGKKILFVSQKAAALQVVQQNLGNLGLGDLSLVLHSDTMPRKDVIEALRGTLTQDPPRPARLDSAREELQSAQAALVAHVESTSTPIAGYDISFHEAVGRQSVAQEKLSENTDGNGEPSIILRDGLSRNDIFTAISVAEELQSALQKLTPISEHPFIGSSATAPLLPAARMQASKSLRSAAESAKAFEEALSLFCSKLQLTIPRSLQESSGLIEALTTIRDNEESLSSLASVNLNLPGWRLSADARPSAKLSPLSELNKLRDSLKGLVSNNAWQIPEPDSLVTRIQGLRNDRFFFLKGDYWRLRSEMRSAYRAPKLFETWENWFDVANTLSKAHDLRNTLSSEPLNSFMRGLLTEPVWKGPDTDLALATRVASLCEGLVADHSKEPYFSRTAEVIKDPASQSILHEQLATLNDSYQKFRLQLAAAMDLVNISSQEVSKQFYAKTPAEISSRLTQMADQIERLDEVASINRIIATLSDAGITLPVRALQEHGEYMSRRLSTKIEHQWVSAAVSFHAQNHLNHQSIRGAEVAGLCARYDHSVKHMLAENRQMIASHHWSGVPRAIAAGQAGYLNNEVEKKRNFRPIRELMANSGGAIQAIKPVIMASPASVARFLSPDSLLHFDAVIIDEGSQVPPEEALGPLARGAQMIIVGDSKQMPPSRLFSKSLDPDDDEGELAAESVLDMAVRQGIPPQMLTHHRRSRHPSLIQLASKFHYDDRLQVIPSPIRNGTDQGLRFCRVEDAVYDRGGTGTNKIEAAAIVDAIAQHATKHPERSLGVVAFNVKQAEEILLQLEKRAREDDVLSKFLQTQHSDRPFFVRSLENVQGDERDTVFISVGFGYGADGKFPMSFGPLNNEGGERRLNVLMTRARWECRIFSSFDPHDLRVEEAGLGLKHLKEYLLYAKTRSETTQATEDVSVKRASHPFALALQSKLAKEGIHAEELIHTDGSVDLAIIDPNDRSRHCLAILLDGSPGRDSLPGAALPDRRTALQANGWRTHFVSTADLLYRPTQVIQEICQLARDPEKIAPKPRADAANGIERSNPSLTPANTPVRDYKKLEIPDNVQVLGLQQKEIQRWIEKVVTREAPIHADELFYRLRAGKKATDVLKTAFNSALQAAIDAKTISITGEFLWVSEHTDVLPIRSRSAFAATRKKIELIHPKEIEATLLYLVHASHGIAVDELPAATLSTLGLNPENEGSLGAIASQIDSLIAEGKLREQRGFYTA